MNEYLELLTKLLELTTITIKSATTESNLRKGLKNALKDYNDSQAIMELDEEERVVRISTKTIKTTEGQASNTYTISLVAKDAPRQGAFTFELVE